MNGTLISDRPGTPICNALLELNRATADAEGFYPITVEVPPAVYDRIRRELGLLARYMWIGNELPSDIGGVRIGWTIEVKCRRK